MCVKSLLGGPRADLWPFYGLYSKRISLYIKVYPQASQAHVTSVLCKLTFSQESRCRGVAWATPRLVNLYTERKPVYSTTH